MNSISPLKVSGFAISAFSFVINGSIFPYSSTTVKIFSAAFRPFAVEGPYCFADPAEKAPNMIAKIAMKISSASAPFFMFFKNPAAARNTMK